ncbi:MAG: GNAT family N-acetyltransferase [Defluviitaleaceae bacterium]|nr:GNAT family N-acetyltransferase [Defluviitaleaceae bacterium]
MYTINGQDLKAVENLFAEYKHNIPVIQCVLEGNNAGSAFVDDTVNPSWAVLQLPIGFHYVAGKPMGHGILDDILFNHILPSQDEKEIIVFSPSDEWQPLLESVFAPRGGERLIRKIFDFNREMYQVAEERFYRLPDKAEMVTVQERLDGNFNKADSWMAKLQIGGDCISTCTAIMTGGGQAEIGVDTKEGHQGRGYATLTALALIEKLLEIGLTPCWAAWDFREASIKLAEKIGFTPAPDAVAWVWYEKEEAEG